MKKRVADDLAALQLRQREALNEVTAAAAVPPAYKPVRGEETLATRPMSNQVTGAYWLAWFTRECNAILILLVVT